MCYVRYMNKKTQKVQLSQYLILKSILSVKLTLRRLMGCVYPGLDQTREKASKRATATLTDFTQLHLVITEHHMSSFNPVLHKEFPFI